MSVDVDYFSFSPSRADKEWPNFVEDFLVLRKRHAPWDDYVEDARELEKQKEKIEATYEPKIKKAAHDAFAFFKDKGFVIPWVDWETGAGTDRWGNVITMSDVDKIDYLQSAGVVYPADADHDAKNLPFMSVSRDAPQLFDDYESVVDRMNRDIAALSGASPISDSQDTSVALNERQDAIEKDSRSSYLIYENVFDEESLLRDLITVDLYYGSRKTDYFEDPKIEHWHLLALIDVFDMKTDGNIPLKDELIRVFTTFTPRKLEEVIQWMMREMDWDHKTSDGGFREYVRSVRPLVKDLENVPDALLVREYGGGEKVEPNSAQELLMKRAKKHAEQFKGLLPPVL